MPLSQSTTEILAWQCRGDRDRWPVNSRHPEQDHGLIEANDGPFKHHLDRYKYPNRHGSDPVRHREEGLELLGPLEARLAAQANLCGEYRGLADVAIFPFVRQLAKTYRAWFDPQPLPRLQAWLAHLVASPLFGAVMLRLDP